MARGIAFFPRYKTGSCVDIVRTRVGATDGKSTVPGCNNALDPGLPGADQRVTENGAERIDTTAEANRHRCEVDHRVDDVLH